MSTPQDNRDGKNGKHGNHKSHASHQSHSSKPQPEPKQEPERILVPRGDYRFLRSFQKAEVIYDFTFRFAHKFLSRGDRTIDQMIQSARSGKKNILEGSKEFQGLGVELADELDHANILGFARIPEAKNLKLHA